MTRGNIASWFEAFQRDATADGQARLRRHLHRLNLPDSPELLLGGTMQVVVACCAYAELDGRSTEEFLAMQQYDAESRGHRGFTFTFDLCGKAYGRVHVPATFGILDLADLYGHPWEPYRVVGFRDFYVSRIADAPLDDADIALLEQHVSDDLRYDYTEDELDFWFDLDECPGSLVVHLQDVESAPPEDTIPGSDNLMG
jgi:hypothetical protein